MPQQTDYDDLIRQIDAVTSGPAPAAPQVTPPLRFQDPEGTSFSDNLKQSGQAQVHGVMDMFRHPDEALSAITSLITEQDSRDAAMAYIKESYGSFDKFKRSVYNDPMGVASELSVAGLPLKVGGRVMSVPKMERAGTAIEHLDPSMAVSTGMKAATANTGALIQDPQRAYEESLRMSVSPSNKYSNRQVRNRVTTQLLDNQVPLTPEGVAGFQRKISEATQRLDAAVDAADRAGTRISMGDLLENLRPLVSDLGDAVTNPESVGDMKTLRNYIGNWVLSMGPRRDFSPSEVRKLRQTLDAKIGWGKVDQTTPPTLKRVREGVANSARGELAQALDTGDGSLAQEIGGMLEALEPAERAAARLNQQNKIGLREAGFLGAGGIGASVGDTFVERMAPLVLSGAAAYLINRDTKLRFARAVWRNKRLDDAAKRTLLRQLVDTSAEVGLGAQEMNDGRAEG